MGYYSPRDPLHSNDVINNGPLTSWPQLLLTHIMGYDCFLLFFFFVCFFKSLLQVQTSIICLSEEERKKRNGSSGERKKEICAALFCVSKLDWSAHLQREVAVLSVTTGRQTSLVWRDGEGKITASTTLSTTETTKQTAGLPVGAVLLLFVGGRLCVCTSLWLRLGH